MDGAPVARHLAAARCRVVRGANRFEEHLGGRDPQREGQGAVAVVGKEPVVRGPQRVRETEQEGLVSSEWRAGDGGPGRKYFTITTTGREVLVRSAAGWADFSARISSILGGARSRGGR